MVGGVQERSADGRVATDEGSQPCGEEGETSQGLGCSCQRIHTRVPDRPQEDGVCGVLTEKGKKPASPGNALPKCCRFAVPLWTGLRDRQRALLQVLSLEDRHSLLMLCHGCLLSSTAAGMDRCNVLLGDLSIL